MTRNELIRLAYNRLGMGVDGVEITAGQYALADTFLNAAMAEINTEAAFYFNADEVPPEARLAVADLIAADIAPSFSFAAPRSRAGAKLALLAIIRPDDRKDVAEPEFF
jgi:hypothetical protein